jgi:hypothetical protein
MSAHDLPEIAAVLLADTVDQEDDGGRIHLIGGGVRAIVASALPTMHQRLGMLVAIRTPNGAPEPAEMTVHLIDPDEDEIELLRGELSPVSSGPGTIVWVGFNLPPLRLTRTGEYRFELRGVGATTYAVNIDVVLADGAEGEPEDDHEVYFRPLRTPGTDRPN